MQGPGPSALRGASLGLAIALAALLPRPGVASQPIEEIVVVGDRAIAPAFAEVGSVSVLDRETIAETAAEHVHELMVRVPGVWVSRGSGEEHLTAIRSPVLTGAGACGAFLFMEDGVPIRPPGFCNVNNLFEVATEMAAAIEVARGPASGLFGGNALNGVINVISPDPQGEELSARAEVGPWGHYQVALSKSHRAGRHALRLDALGTHTNGYREATGFGEQKLALVHRFDAGRWELRSRIAGSLLDQETGGFVHGKSAFRDHHLRRSNPNPEAFRDASSARLVIDARRETRHGELQVTPYVRRSRMRFLQHFLPGQPTERNGQTSAGSIALWRSEHLTSGARVEYASSYLEEFQAREFSPTRPAGLHYDYRVHTVLAALHYDLRWPLGERVTLVHGLRGEYVRHDYDNRGPDGNGRGDGGSCPGGCLFSRPADRDDSFVSAGGRVGLNADLGRGAEFYGLAAHGFRPPQISELYRLQSGQTVADLDSERLTSGELGIRIQRPRWGAEVAGFLQHKRNVILRDADGFNVSDGATDGAGVEFSARAQPLTWLGMDLAGAWNRFQYDFDRRAARGEVITSGNDVDTAPRLSGSARVRVEPGAGLTAELEIVRQGRYYLNAANTADYEGHTLVNLRMSWRPTTALRIFVRMMNVLDEEYADRADFAFGSFRYFPGEPRRVFAGIELTLNSTP